MRSLAVIVLIGCADGGDNSSADLSAPDLSEPCPGYTPLETGPCSHAGSGWRGPYCYPNSLTYCICGSDQMWQCCGDQPPTCDADPPATGDRCCAFDDGQAFTCRYDGDAGLAEQCTCNKPTLTWSCTHS